MQQLRFPLGQLDPDAVEEALTELGADAVSFLEGGSEHPVFEPERGTTPLWDQTQVLALFGGDADLDAVSAELAETLGTPASDQGWEPIEDQVWERAWLKDFRPLRFGHRLWVVPSGFADPDQADAVILRLDPGLAFGTGTHPTTAMCLAWLDGADLRDRLVLDYGCGSGILAVAALALGARQAICVDTDPQALTATRDNADRNGLAHCVACYEPDELPAGLQADVTLANILAGPLTELAPELLRLTRPGGELVLSGILESQATEVAAAYEHGLTATELRCEDDWVRMSGTVRPEAPDEGDH